MIVNGYDIKPGANLSGSIVLAGANLEGANLHQCDFTDAYLVGANLEGADLSGSNFTRANLRGANLKDTNLIGTDLTKANLSGADLTKANLSGANLRNANLSGAIGIISQADYIRANFEVIEIKGVLVGFYAYKTFWHYYDPPEYWEIEAGAIIKEVLNHSRADGCGSGVNVAKRDYHDFCFGRLWKVKITNLLDVVVPYNTRGKIRVGECELIEVVEVLK